MRLDDEVKYLKGVGPKRAQALKRLGIVTIYDLLSYYPKGYTDQSEITPIANLEAGTIANIRGRICGIKEQMTRNRLTILTAFIDDGTDVISAIWFNKKFLKEKLRHGTNIFLHGKIEYAYGGQGRCCMKNITSFEIDPQERPVNFVPVYALVEGIKAKFLCELMTNAFAEISQIPDAFSPELKNRYGLLAKREAMYTLHFPKNKDSLAKARYTLIFEELFLLQYGRLHIKSSYVSDKKNARCLANGSLVEQVTSLLPFHLTKDQQKAWQGICRDMEAPYCMQRLLQGDVGSGKTVVALLALAKAVENGYQGAFMAPTEILAQQHYLTFVQMLKDTNITIGLLTGSLSSKEHRQIIEATANGTCQIVIGTHALIQDKVSFSNLGLVITDEQHRFGIEQRARLGEKSCCQPDTLIMTATPIPRTMTLTFYGDLSVSSIYHLPPGRKPIRTFLRTPQARDKIYQFILEQIEKGYQAYVVCPLIAESDSIKVVCVESIYEELANGIFKDVPCGLLHGKLPAEEKEQIMQDFAANKLKLLISTTVIEVGVNVPNASVMVIEGAERFGLAQLHQLRGRIGRGSAQSYCIMVSYNKNENSQQRLKLMEEVSDGFALAEADLKLRGPGQFFGSLQHGLPDLKIASLLDDLAILKRARECAAYCFEAHLGEEAIKKIIALQYKEDFAKFMRN